MAHALLYVRLEAYVATTVVLESATAVSRSDAHSSNGWLAAI